MAGRGDEEQTGQAGGKRAGCRSSGAGSGGCHSKYSCPLVNAATKVLIYYYSDLKVRVRRALVSRQYLQESSG